MEKEKTIVRYMRAQMYSLARDERALEQSGSKANLAQLRRGIGKQPGELPELWGLLLKNMPEEWMRSNGEPSYEERAVYAALTLFALHQQGHSQPMHAEGEGNRLGQAARKLARSEEDEENIRKKLSIVARSDDMAELSYSLKTIVRLLGSSGIRDLPLEEALKKEAILVDKHEKQLRIQIEKAHPGAGMAQDMPISFHPGRRIYEYRWIWESFVDCSQKETGHDAMSELG